MADTDKRYSIQLECGHTATGDYPPLNRTYPCVSCPPGTPFQPVQEYRDHVQRRTVVLAARS